MHSYMYQPKYRTCTTTLIAFIHSKQVHILCHNVCGSIWLPEGKAAFDATAVAVLVVVMCVRRVCAAAALVHIYRHKHTKHNEPASVQYIVCFLDRSPYCRVRENAYMHFSMAMSKHWARAYLHIHIFVYKIFCSVMRNLLSNHRCIHIYYTCCSGCMHACLRRTTSAIVEMS